jgi:catechol 2,3-dioxygenase-like lactoylglutathione lyase family enzyme
MSVISIAGLAYVGIRVHDLDRSLAFYSLPDVSVAKSRLLAAAISVREGPVRFATGAPAIFVRDPDGNVIELNQPVPDRG